IAIVFPLAILFMALSVLIGIGSNALFSIYLGRKDEEKARYTLGNAVVSLSLVAIFALTLSYLFLENILVAFGATPEILPYAVSYTKPLLIGNAMAMVTMGLNHFIRSSGHPKTAMATQIIGAVINLILAPLFIFTFKMGMAGAAWAVVCGQACSSVWVIVFLVGKKTKYRLQLKYLNTDFMLFWDSIKIGFSQFIFQLANSLLNIILNHSLVKYGGNLAVSAMGIVIAINTIIIMPVIGISQGAQPLIGYNYGARKYNTAIQTLKMAIRWSIIVTITGFIITEIFAKQFVSIFNSTDESLINLTASALRYFNIMLPLVPMQILTTAFFQATNKPLKALILSLSRQVLLLIPAVLILPLFWGLKGVFIATPVADFISILLSSYMLRKYFTKHKQNFFFSKKF
ncbi:MAG: MATE family efflux transporter, partial [Elusimicrobiaceae bacterium]|nr:MATE family efflux transporter [Elusimicrobiaceae bacterium]